MLIKVKVHPRSKKEEVKRGEVWEVWVMEPPLEGRANEAVIKLLKRYFKRARLVKGQKSRIKVFEVE